jgi:hypothetical protein
MKKKGVFLPLIGFIVACLLAAPAGANSLRSDVLYVLPSESGEVGFIDLQALRASRHYDLLKKRFLPTRFSHFERFIRSMGVDTENDMEWLAWALVPAGPENSTELFVGVAQGQFLPESVADYFARQKLPTLDYHGQTLFPFGRGKSERGLLFTFLDASTAAFGTRRSLEGLLDTRLGERESLLKNEALLSQIYDVNGREPIWVVLDEHYTRLAVRQLLPQVAQFEQFGEVVTRFRSGSLYLRVDREVTLSFQAQCSAPEDVQVLSLLLQTGLAAQSWQVQESNPILSDLLRRTDVRTAGDLLEVSVYADENELQTLLSRRELFY